MSFTFLIGKKGSGKSLFLLHHITRELRRTNRQIITTLAVDIPELNSYMQKKYPNETIDVCNRVHVIGKEEQRAYWRYRGTRVISARFGESDEWNGIPGVFYAIDELQVGFGARQWAERGAADRAEVTEYSTQERKMGDDSIFTSPAAALVDKQFRILCDECVVMANWYKLRISWLKAPRQIRYQIYQNTPPDRSEDAVGGGHIKIDAEGLAKCYNTAAGVGVVGEGSADKGQEAKGIPFWLVPIGVVAAAAIAITGTDAALKHVRKNGLMGYRGLSEQRVVLEAAKARPQVLAGGGVTLEQHRMTTNEIAKLIKTEPNTARKPQVERRVISYGGDPTKGMFEVTYDNGDIDEATNVMTSGGSVIIDGRRYARAKRSR